MIKLKSIISLESLIEQAALEKGKKTRPGLDGMSGAEAHLWMQINGESLIRDLLSDRYEPIPALSYTTAKRSGSYRRLSLLSVKDKIIQSCLLNALNESCESFFCDSSFAFRPNKGLGAALHQYCDLAEPYSAVVRIDPTSCFDNINHDILIHIIQEYLHPDKPLLQLLLKYIKLDIIIDQQLEQRSQGILQGSPLSPLFCNLYFHPLDLWLSGKDLPFVRYADDIAVFFCTLQEAKEQFQQICDFITNTLKLSINAKKSNTGSSLELPFLGHSFSKDRHGIIALSKSHHAKEAFHIWHQEKLNNSHRRIDLLSEGVLRQNDFSMLFETAETSHNIPPAAIEMVNVYSNVIFDSGFLRKANDYGIYVNLFDNHGDLVGRFVPAGTLKAPIVTYEQIQAYYDQTRRLYLAREFVLSSIHNLRLVIRYYHKHHPKDQYTQVLDNINKSVSSIKKCRSHEELLLQEAAVRKMYYNCYDLFIDSSEFSFEKRTRRPPENPFNAMLSFGNTILYNMLAFKINKSPLDIRIGFLHATNSTRSESLNLDIAEIFKPIIIDRVILSLINLRSIQKDHFTYENNGAVYLNENGKKVFLKAFYDKLEDGLYYKEKYFSYEMLLDEEIRKLVRYFRNSEQYKAYRQVR